MTIWIREFRNSHTGRRYEVASSEPHLPLLRRRLIAECGREPGWDNESIYEHQVGFDLRLRGDLRQIEIKELPSPYHHMLRGPAICAGVAGDNATT